jgi:hypothetical protein
MSDEEVEKKIKYRGLSFPGPPPVPGRRWGKPNQDFMNSIKPTFHGQYETMDIRPDYENLRSITSSVVVEAAYSYANENWHLYDSEDYKYGWSVAYEDYLEHGDKLLEE